MNLQLKVAYGSLDELVRRQSVDLSQGGMFIRTRDQHPVGTPVTLEIRIHGGAQVIRGKGIISRVVAPLTAASDGVPGLGIQFTDLDAESRALVAHVVASLSPKAPETAAAPVAAGTEGPPPEIGPALPPTVPRARRVVGIDLGTTNSCVAIAEGGRPRVLTSKGGHRTIPSIAAVDAQGRLLVGHAARPQLLVNPRQTVYGSKRLIGRPFASPTVQDCRERFHYEIVEGTGGGAAVRFAGRDLSLQQITALLLRELRNLASSALGEEVTRAVVTVPAYYDDHQRRAVREAGRLAGLEISRIVNEPTAAALAFGFGKGLAKRVLVYDLGGGTFDASVVEIEGEVYEVVSTGGDTFLGGVDFDARLEDHLAAAFTARHGVSLPDDPATWQRLREAAETTKIALSEADRARAHVPFLSKAPDGSDLALDVEVTRAELEALTADLVARTLEVCKEVLDARGLTPEALGEIVLIGGQSRMPLVSRRLREMFGREPSHGANPDEAVAEGAAILAESEARIDSVVLIDVLAMGIGIGLPGGRIAPVFPRNARLPARRGYEVQAVPDAAAAVELAIFQGDSPRAAECEYLSTVRVAGLRAAPGGAVRLSVDFALGAEGIVSATARNLATGELLPAEVAAVDTPERVRELLQMKERQTAPKGARPIAAPLRARPAAPGARPTDTKGFLGRIFGKR